MAAKSYYFKNAVPTGATLHRSLQDGGTAPTAATTTTGWVLSNKAAGQSCIQTGGSEYASAGANWGTTLQPAAAPSQTIGDCWRSENTITGQFANANWTFNFGFRSVTAAWDGRCKLAVRLWRAANANGTGAVELTGGRVASAATAANLSTSADTTLSWTWSPGAAFTLTNEYLFVQVGIEITTAGTTGTTKDFDFRVGSAYTLVTPDFATVTSAIAAAEAGDTADVAVSVTTGAVAVATESMDAAAIDAAVTTGSSISASDAADSAALAGTNWRVGGIASSDSADAAAIATTVTAAANLSAIEAPDAAAIGAEIWRAAQLNAAESADQTVIGTAVTAGAALTAADAADQAALVAANWVAAGVIASDTPDVTAIDSAVTAGADVAAGEASDGAAIGADANPGVTTGGIAAAETSDLAAIVASVGIESIPVAVRPGGGRLSRSRRRPPLRITYGGIAATESADACAVMAGVVAALGDAARDGATVQAAWLALRRKLELDRDDEEVLMEL